MLSRASAATRGRWVRRMCGLSSDKSFFQLLGAPYSFAQDERKLSTEYKSLMKKWHPDRHSGNSDEHAKALDMTATINVAYETLRKPHLRARYILQNEGVPLEENEEQAVDDPEFLLHVMSVREALEESPSQEELADLRKEATQMQQSCLAEAEAAFQDLSKNEEKKFLVRRLTSKLQYLNRIVEEIQSQIQVK